MRGHRRPRARRRVRRRRPGPRRRAVPPRSARRRAAAARRSGVSPHATNVDTKAWFRCVPPATIAVAHERAHAVDHRDRGALDACADTRTARELAEMTEQTEAGDVGGAVHCVAERPSRVASARIERGHDVDRGGEQLGTRTVALHRGRDHAEPDRLGEHERIAGLRARVAPDAVGFDGADDGQSELRLRVVDRVPTRDQRARRARDVGATVDDAGEQLERQSLARPGDEVQREDRRGSHRVHVGQRVGGGDAPPVVGVVDDRCEEVGGEDEREVVTEAVDGGVVGRVQADDQVRVVGRLETADESEDRAQVVRGELAGAARAVGEAREPELGIPRCGDDAQPWTRP